MIWRFAGWVLALLLCGFTAAHVWKSYPQHYFRPPVHGAMYLSGTFGELRPNHFHTGIDVKPAGGKTGQAILAAAEGYIERIKVEAAGYGKVLYIRHPNGYTTVYAHLQNFTPEVEEYVKKVQYTRQQFYVNLHPKKQEFPVKKGQEIGKLGNSGSSSGPHLHFEIRQSATGLPLNPLLFGLDFKDPLPPQLHQLKVYALNDKLETTDSRVYAIEKKDRAFSIKGDTVVLGAWRAGFALRTYDHMPGGAKQNGIYKLELLKNDSLRYDFEFEKLEFGESRYANAHMDYQERILKKGNFHRCFTLPGNRLSFYKKNEEGGVVALFKDKATKITLHVKDVSGNVSSLTFWIKRGEISALPSPVFNYKLPWNQENIISNEDVELTFPKGTFYEDCYLRFQKTNDNSANYLSPVHRIHDYKTPVHLYYKIALTPSAPLPENLKTKAFIAFCNRNSKIQNCGGFWKGEKLIAEVRSLGDYSIMLDTVAPLILPKLFSKNMQQSEKMTFKITDNFPPSGKAKDLRYRATVDEKWILMEYDAKNDLLIHRFDGRISTGEHKLRLEVTDDRGNKAVFEDTFTR